MWKPWGQGNQNRQPSGNEIHTNQLKNTYCVFPHPILPPFNSLPILRMFSSSFLLVAWVTNNLLPTQHYWCWLSLIELLLTLKRNDIVLTLWYEMLSRISQVSKLNSLGICKKNYILWYFQMTKFDCYNRESFHTIHNPRWLYSVMSVRYTFNGIM